jgi:hypothetical protein
MLHYTNCKTVSTLTFNGLHPADISVEYPEEFMLASSLNMSDSLKLDEISSSSMESTDYDWDIWSTYFTSEANIDNEYTAMKDEHKGRKKQYTYF